MSGSSSGRIGRIVTGVPSRSFQTVTNCDGIWTNCEGRQIAFPSIRIVQDDPRVERERRLGRDQKRIDVDFLDPSLLRNELTETHEQLFERAQVDRALSAHAAERLVNARSLHHAACQSGIEGRKGERAVFEGLDEVPARAKKEHRAELWIDTAPNNQLTAAPLDHPLNSNPAEPFRTRDANRRFFDGVKGLLDGCPAAQEELHTADVALMSDRMGIELEDDGIADARRDLDSFARHSSRRMSRPQVCHRRSRSASTLPR